MSLTSYVLVAALAFTSVFPITTGKSSVHRTIDHAKDSLVRVASSAEETSRDVRICSGFVVARNRVQTAAHCLSEGRQTIDGESATLIAVSAELDLALFSAKTNKHSLVFAHEIPELYSEVFGLGFAFGFTEPVALFSRVQLWNYAPTANAFPGLLTQGDWIHGMSGGPVLDLQGYVVGIMQRTHEGLGYGVSAPTIIRFLQAVGVTAQQS